MLPFVSLCKLQEALPLTRGFEPLAAQSLTPLLYLHFGSRFVCGPSLQISSTSTLHEAQVSMLNKS